MLRGLENLCVEGAYHAASATVEDVDVDHGGFDVAVTEEFLNSADVGAALEEVGGAGVAEGVATDALCNNCRSHGLFEGFL